MTRLTTIAAVRAFAGIASTDLDSLIDACILRASAAVQNFTQRTLLSASYSELRDGHGGAEMLLREYPVTAVASVAVDGQSIPPAPDFSGAGWRLADRSVLLNGYRFTRGAANVTIGYTAGYADLAALPDDIEHAVIETVQLMIERRKHIDVSSKSLAGETVSYITAELTPSSKQILQSYRRVAPL